MTGISWMDYLAVPVTNWRCGISSFPVSSRRTEMDPSLSYSETPAAVCQFQTSGTWGLLDWRFATVTNEFGGNCHWNTMDVMAVNGQVNFLLSGRLWNTSSWFVEKNVFTFFPGTRGSSRKWTLICPCFMCLFHGRAAWNIWGVPGREMFVHLPPGTLRINRQMELSCCCQCLMCWCWNTLRLWKINCFRALSLITQITCRRRGSLRSRQPRPVSSARGEPNFSSAKLSVSHFGTPRNWNF